jgi:hypothetical protein
MEADMSTLKNKIKEKLLKRAQELPPEVMPQWMQGLDPRSLIAGFGGGYSLGVPVGAGGALGGLGGGYAGGKLGTGMANYLMPKGLARVAGGVPGALVGGLGGAGLGAMAGGVPGAYLSEEAMKFIANPGGQ